MERERDGLKQLIFLGGIQSHVLGYKNSFGTKELRVDIVHILSLSTLLLVNELASKDLNTLIVTFRYKSQICTIFNVIHSIIVVTGQIPILF